MTAQEALDKLDKTVLRDLEWKIALTKALEKQIPKKLTIKPAYDYSGVPFTVLCPNCLTNIGYEAEHTYKYCFECGQKLDWN